MIKQTCFITMLWSIYITSEFNSHNPRDIPGQNPVFSHVTLGHRTISFKYVIYDSKYDVIMCLCDTCHSNTKFFTSFTNIICDIT